MRRSGSCPQFPYVLAIALFVLLNHSARCAEPGGLAPRFERAPSAESSKTDVACSTRRGIGSQAATVNPARARSGGLNPPARVRIAHADLAGPRDREEAPHGGDKTDSASGKPLVLHLRRRVETKPGSGRFHAVTESVAWEPAKTAIVVCDMWNQHWCRGATRRVAEMAPRMNEVLTEARQRGVLIIHCPSDTMKFYAGTPQRERARQAPHISTKTPLTRSCGLDAAHEGRLPIDDSDGGCDCDPPCKQGSPWTHEIDTLQIAPQDAITDSVEAIYLLRERGIENVIVMGVHTNMCVLGRPFSIRQLVHQGFNVVLMRDMTDTMYNSRSAPFVSHFTGTDLVVEHIEKHWCPTIVSTDFLGGREFRFSEDRRPTLAVLIAEPEYDTNRTLPEFVAKELGKDFRVNLIFGSETDPADVPGIDALKDADVLLVSVRRRPLAPAQMQILRDWVSQGKPVVGIRTACHAFSLRGKQPRPPLETWEAWDPQVFGGHYVNHHANGIKSTIRESPQADSNPILQGVDIGKLVGNGSLYLVSPLNKSAKPLLTGTIPGKPSEPVAWTFVRADGGKSFYTSLGHPDDFTEAAFRKLLVNALHWAAKK
jgi:nicotinamidase-related amidase/type 1 glutamine amidotransferase